MNDPYVYDNGTLINKLDIKDYHTLNRAEADIGFLKLIDVDSIEIVKCNVELLKKIHKHIFEDIFSWAGVFRTIPLYKEEVVIPGVSLNYANVEDINILLQKGFEDLNNTVWDLNDFDNLAYTFARKLALLWRVHPFRDGNTRTFLSFAYIFAKKHGFAFDIEFFARGLSRQYEEGNIVKYSIRDYFVLASLDTKDYPEVEPLAHLFKSSIKLQDISEIDISTRGI